MRSNWLKILNAAAALSLILTFAACEDLLGGGDGGNGGKLDGGNLPADKGTAPSGLVTTKNAGQTVEVTFASGGEQFLVVPYSVSSTAADAIDFDLTIKGSGSDGGIGTTSHKLRWKRPDPLRLRNPKLWLRWQQRLEVERWTRNQAVIAAASRLVPLPGGMNKPLAGCTTSAGCKGTEVCHKQACASAVSLNVAGFSTAGTISVKMRKKGTKAAVLVDATDTVSDTTVNAILEKFEKVIYPRDVGLFGNPALTSGGKTLSTDRNADGLVWLVISKQVSNKKAAVGFFNAVDFSETHANSNKADILYIDAASTKKTSDVYTILAHEFQHLLNFAVKKYRPEKNGKTGTLEALWLDEGLSHLAEGACGFGGENVTLLNQELFTAFEDYAVFFKEDDKGNRAMALLYLQYLFEQKGGVKYNADGSVTDGGGAAFLKALRATSKQGTAAIDGAYGDHKSAFDNWIATVALDGRGVTSYAGLNYKSLVTDPVGGGKIGLRVRGTLKDHTGASVTLKGPLEDNLTGAVNDAVVNASARFYLLKGKSGKVAVKVSTTESNFRFAVIKLK